jgi:hypothetical protein
MPTSTYEVELHSRIAVHYLDSDHFSFILLDAQRLEAGEMSVYIISVCSLLGLVIDCYDFAVKGFWTLWHNVNECLL